MRSPPCPCTPSCRRAYIGDAGHRARLGNHFLQVSQPSSTRAQPAVLLCVYPCTVTSVGMPAMRVHPRALPPSRAARFGPVRTLGARARTHPSPHAHAHVHAHAPRSLASGRPRPELAAGLFPWSVQARTHALETHLAGASYPQPRRLLFPRLNLCETEPCARSRVRAWQAEHRRLCRHTELPRRLRHRGTLRHQGIAFL
jgi:hypothetical protein